MDQLIWPAKTQNQPAKTALWICSVQICWVGANVSQPESASKNSVANLLSQQAEVACSWTASQSWPAKIALCTCNVQICQIDPVKHCAPKRATVLARMKHSKLFHTLLPSFASKGIPMEPCFSLRKSAQLRWRMEHWVQHNPCKISKNSQKQFRASNNEQDHASHALQVPFQQSETSWSAPIMGSRDALSQNGSLSVMFQTKIFCISSVLQAQRESAFCHFGDAQKIDWWPHFMWIVCAGSLIVSFEFCRVQIDGQGGSKWQIMSPQCNLCPLGWHFLSPDRDMPIQRNVSHGTQLSCPLRSCLLSICKVPTKLGFTSLRAMNMGWITCFACSMQSRHGVKLCWACIVNLLLKVEMAFFGLLNPRLLKCIFSLGFSPILETTFNFVTLQLVKSAHFQWHAHWSKVKVHRSSMKEIDEALLCQCGCMVEAHPEVQQLCRVCVLAVCTHNLPVAVSCTPLWFSLRTGTLPPKCHPNGIGWHLAPVSHCLSLGSPQKSLSTGCFFCDADPTFGVLAGGLKAWPVLVAFPCTNASHATCEAAIKLTFSSLSMPLIPSCRSQCLTMH